MTATTQRSHEHPTQELVFFVGEGQGNALRDRVRALIGQLGAVRRWQCGPPQIVDEHESDEADDSGEQELDTVGGRLEVYSAMPVGSLPKELDAQAFGDVSTVIQQVADFSRSHGVVIEFLLDGNPVGKIKSGRLDRLLEQGLLGEWKRHLGLDG